MARYPGAHWNPAGTPGGTISPRVVILHTMAVNAFARPKAANGLEWHFGVHWSGKVEQHVDTSKRADANNKANAFAISIETEDDGDPATQPWSEEQMVALARLVRWCCDTHGIPKVRCNRWDGTGIGYHTMWGAPSQWTPVAKTCPGKARIAQFPRLLQMVAGTPTPRPPEDDDMAVIVKYPGPTGADMYEVTDWVRRRGITGPAELAELQTAGLRTVAVSAATAAAIPKA